MLKTLAACNNDATAPDTAYTVKFSQRRHIDAKAVRCVEQRLLETGDLIKFKKKSFRTSRDTDY